MNLDIIPIYSQHSNEETDSWILPESWMIAAHKWAGSLCLYSSQVAPGLDRCWSSGSEEETTMLRG
jgi:hypothetical protein